MKFKMFTNIENIKQNLLFKYVVQKQTGENQTITIMEYLGTDEICIIPEVIDGLLVTRIQKYAFHEHRELREVTIPSGVWEIGAHAFYNCTSLEKIVMADHVHSIGDGAFKNCDSVSFVELNRNNTQMHTLKGLLAEFNQEIKVMLHNSDGDAVLIFPYYMHDFEENTPARIINQVTVGSGMYYRECVTGEEVNYHQYDSIFETARYLDVSESIYEIALYRLKYSYHLSDKSKEEYIKFLYQNRMKLVDDFLVKDENDKLENLLKLELMNRSDLDEMIEMARNFGAMKGLSILLQYQNEKFGVKKKTFEF